MLQKNFLLKIMNCIENRINVSESNGPVKRLMDDGHGGVNK